MKPKYKCLMCMQFCESNYCSRCKSDSNVCDTTLPHAHHWSRKSLYEVECKICGIVQSTEDYYKNGGG